MHQVRALTFRAAHNISDLGIFFVAFAFGSLTWVVFRFGNFDIFFDGRYNWHSTFMLFLIFYGSNFFYLAYYRAYHSSRLRSFGQATGIYLKSTFMALLLASLIEFLLPFLSPSRAHFISSSVYALLLLMLKEVVMRYVLGALRKRGFFRRRAVVIGCDVKRVKEISESFLKDHLMGIEVSGIILPNSEVEFEHVEEDVFLKCLGDIEDIANILDEHCVDIAIFFAREISDEDLARATWICEERGLEVWVHLDFLDRLIYHSSLDHLHGVPFINFQGTPQNEAALFTKLVLDKILALGLIFVLSPLMLLIACLIKFTSPGPVIFSQFRAGLNGRKFLFYKFRTMVEDAEERKSELLSLNENSGPAFKLREDPRITKLGQFLRKTSLDELPQLWNVIRGDMSLVGPRPLPLEEVKEFDGWHRRRLSMRPGITGKWQVEGRSNVSDFNNWAQMDLDYIDQWSLEEDFTILLKTIPAVLFGRGAH